MPSCPAAAGNGFNKPGILGIVTDRGAKPLQNDIQASIKIYIGPFRPQPLPQILTADNCSRMLKQDHQKPERLFLDFDFRAAAGKPPVGRIRLEQSKMKDNARGDCGFH